MDMLTIRKMLAWCTVINFGILILWFVMLTAAHGFVQDLHLKWFGLTANQFDVVVYSAMAVYKIGWLLLNVVPYLALRIIDRKTIADK